MAYRNVDRETSRTIRLMAKPDMEFPNMETTLPKVMMVKSLVQRGLLFLVVFIIETPVKKRHLSVYADKCLF